MKYTDKCARTRRRDGCAAPSGSARERARTSARRTSPTWGSWCGTCAHPTSDWTTTTWTHSLKSVVPTVVTCESCRGVLNGTVLGARGLSRHQCGVDNSLVASSGLRGTARTAGSRLSASVGPKPAMHGRPPQPPSRGAPREASPTRARLPRDARTCGAVRLDRRGTRYNFREPTLGGGPNSVANRVASGSTPPVRRLRHGRGRTERHRGI
jgi:hypothetical protein